jgi:hypothetical protein
MDWGSFPWTWTLRGWSRVVWDVDLERANVNGRESGRAMKGCEISPSRQSKSLLPCRMPNVDECESEWANVDERRRM